MGEGVKRTGGEPRRRTKLRRRPLHEHLLPLAVLAHARTSGVHTELKPSRSLIAFAFVKDECDKTRDISRGLMPIFAPIIASMAGQVFSPSKFCDLVAKTYGLHMNVLVAEDWAVRLEEAGYLEATGDKYAKTYVCRSDIVVAEPEQSRNAEELLAKLTSHVQARLAERGLSMPSDEIELGIIGRLQRMEFLSLLLKPDIARNSDPTNALKRTDEVSSGPDKEAILDYILASYLVELSTSDRGSFSLAAGVAAGALVSEVVLSLRQPPAIGSKAARSAVAILDSPFIIDLLDLADRHQSVYANELLADIKRVGFLVRTYEHNVREIRGIVFAALDSIGNVQASTGTVAYRLRTDSAARSRAQAMRATMENRIKALGIQIWNMRETTKANATLFSEEAITELIAKIRPFRDIDSREVDAESVAGVARHVLSRSSVASVLSLPAIFITKNAGLAKLANDVLVQECNYNPDAARPFITDRQAAGLMWLALGGDVNGISTKELLANCSQVVTPRRDVLSEVYKILERTDDRSAKEFEALMSEDRCAHYVMDYTLGDATLVTQDNAVTMLEDVKRKAVEDMLAQDRAAHDAEMADLKKEMDAALRHTVDEYKGVTDETVARYERELEVARSELASKEEHIAEVAHSLEGAMADSVAQVAALERTQETLDAMERVTLMSCARIARRATVARRVGLVLAISVVGAIAGLFTNMIFTIVQNRGVQLAVGAIYAVLSAAIVVVLGWGMPDILFGGRFKKFEIERFQREVERIGLTASLDRWSISPDGGGDGVGIVPREPSHDVGESHPEA